MAPFTFILRKKDEEGEWSAERVTSEEGDLGELPSDASTYKMQRQLYSIALNASSGGSVATTFSTISPTVAIYQARCCALNTRRASGGYTRAAIDCMLSCLKNESTVVWNWVAELIKLMLCEQELAFRIFCLHTAWLSILLLGGGGDGGIGE